MASSPKIFLSDLAPQEKVHFTFSAAEFDLSGKQSFDPSSQDLTDEQVASTLSEAQAHPWLRVEAPKNQAGQDEHALIAAGGAPVADDSGVALDAGKEQTTPVVTGDIAETLAADDTSKTASKVADAPKEG